jgi:hypothetical protein
LKFFETRTAKIAREAVLKERAEILALIQNAILATYSEADSALARDILCKIEVRIRCHRPK